MSELARLTGVGPKRQKALEASGLRTLRDLVYRIPRRYVDRTRITPVASLREGDEAFFVARVESLKFPPNRLLVTVTDGTGSLELAFFRSVALIRQRLREGARLSVAGTVTRFRGLQIVHPEWSVLDGDADPRGGLLPVYPLTGSLEEARAEHKLLQKLALEALDKFSFSDPLSAEERAQLRLRPEKEVLAILHAPESAAAAAAALAELKTRELWPLCVMRAATRRERATRGKPFPATPSAVDAERAVRAALPFRLTGGQDDALKRIGKGLAGPGQFFGLLHGDVGSGKTAVALLSAVRVLAAGAQAALLAPTEILAAQHFRNLAEPLRAAGFMPALLTGDASPEERRRILTGLRAGDIGMVIGTHALLSADVEFRELRFALVDEQHRFGVEQRALLTSKGREPHVLYLSATPIPRTLAQSLYGDLEVVTLAEKPAGRLPVKTRIVPAGKTDELLRFLRTETRDGGNQVYWVVPRITSPLSSPQEGGIRGGRGMADEDPSTAAAIDSAVRRLRAAGDWRVEAVHGRVPVQERERLLAAFRGGEIHVLVATTVIEVGVDVPGANLMVVEGADRFGMAQLHQLRGRTGRGAAQAWCFLLEPPAFGWPEETEARLREFVATEDGFRIAELDLERRGAGGLDAFDTLRQGPAREPGASGKMQSGFGALRFADVVEDAERIRELDERAADWIATRVSSGTTP